MAELAVITPSRGRPDRLAEMLRAVNHTAAGRVDVWVGLDDDDPANYDAALNGLPVGLVIYGGRGPRRSLSGWTNHLAAKALDTPDPPSYLASLGDDHLPRTRGWDTKLIEAVEAMGGSGIAYGNDLLQGGNLPTAWLVSADIVRSVGWMMLPTCEHMYVDNATLEFGRALGRITYRPDVVIEHVHPLAGKAPMDRSYAETNTAQRYAADRAAFEAWRATGLAADAARVQAAIGAVV